MNTDMPFDVKVLALSRELLKKIRLRSHSVLASSTPSRYLEPTRGLASVTWSMRNLAKGQYAAGTAFISSVVIASELSVLDYDVRTL